MVLIKVDLPDPEGPQMTTTSPWAMCVVQWLSTCVDPYHFETSFNSIMMGSLTKNVFAVRAFDQVKRIDFCSCLTKLDKPKHNAKYTKAAKMYTSSGRP